MGVGVALLGLAVGGPTGVTDAAMTGRTVLVVAAGEIDELALSPQAMKATALLNRGDAGGVVTAVLQLSQTLQQLGSGVAGTDQGNNAAHRTRGTER